MKSVLGLSVLLLTTLLPGCSSYVANQVLGDGAIPVDTGKGQRLTAPAVYRVNDDGTYSNAYCVEDFQKNNSLKAITVAKDPPSQDTLTDQLATDNVTVGFPGLPTLSIPYQKNRIAGYTVTRADVQGQPDFYTYVRNGVADKCRALLDSGKFILVQTEARATKSYRVTKGPIDKIQIGPLGIGGLNQEIVAPTPSNSTFGIIGKTGSK